MKFNNSVFTIEGDKEFAEVFRQINLKQQDWVEENLKIGRVFSFYGKYGITLSGFQNPYSPAVLGFIRMAQGILDKNPPFYFDIEKHKNGIDIIKLESGKIYDCNDIGKTFGKPLPKGGYYSAEQTSLLVSMLAYKIQFDFARMDQNKAAMEKHGQCYVALLNSQYENPFVANLIFHFGKVA